MTRNNYLYDLLLKDYVIVEKVISIHITVLEFTFYAEFEKASVIKLLHSSSISIKMFVIVTFIWENCHLFFDYLLNKGVYLSVS